MPRPDLTYPKTPINTINRYAHNAKYDTTTIHSIINSAPVSHVSFAPSPGSAPTILPLIARMGSFASPSSPLSSALSCYLHVSSASHLFQLSPLPVCIAATHIDGLVLSLSPYSHSLNYRSAVLHGTAERVDDVEEKLYAMELITEGIVCGRWKETRVPPMKAEITATGILRVKVESASAKVREGPPKEERADLGDEEVRGRVWTGVVPCWTEYGVPVRSEAGRVEEVPEYLREQIEVWNEEGKKEAEGKAVERK